ncbi:hypothetical protein ACS0TY_019326 [Phlomoides rotata]
MWKLKIAEGSSPWLRSVNGHVGRQTWEFDPSLGSPEELAEIEKLREQFHVTRFEKKHSSDLLMRLQLSKEIPATTDIPQVKVKDVEDITEEKVTNTLRRAISFHSTLQAKDGHWPGDYGGPMFLLPGLVITLSITGTLNAILTEEHRREIRRYLYNHQNRYGGWGLHIEGPSTMIGSVLTYVTLRLLGEGANDGDGSMEKGRDWILEHGGATAITSWGKMWLSVLGAFEWPGNNHLPPEIWLLPYILPIHPDNDFLCRVKSSAFNSLIMQNKKKDVVSLSNGLSSHVCNRLEQSSQTVLSLRKELFTVPYHEIDWNRARSECALVHTAAFNIQSLRSYSRRAFPEDLYYPHPFVQDILWTTLHKVVEPVLLRWPGKKLTEKSLRTVMEHIHYEDENTRYICIGPVNKVLNMLCCWAEDQNSEAFKLHIPRINDFLWLAEEGMKMQGYNGSQLWDAAFAIQAIISTELVEEFGPTLRKAHTYLKNSQVLDDCPGNLDYWYRVETTYVPAIIKILKSLSINLLLCQPSDFLELCLDSSSFDGKLEVVHHIVTFPKEPGHFQPQIMAALSLSKLPAGTVGEPLDAKRLYDAVNVIFSLQNANGGFATYELTRSYSWLELINPAETFGDIVIDYPYVECTSAAIQALTAFKKLYPGHRKEEVEHCIERSAKFIEKIQEADGSWYGSWAVCYTYGHGLV